MIRFACPCCGRWLEVADDLAGRVTVCPKSGRRVPVPVAAFPEGPAGDPAPAPETDFADLVPDTTAQLKQTVRQTRQQQRHNWEALVALLIGGVLGVIGGETIDVGLDTDFSTLLSVLGGSAWGALMGGVIGAVGVPAFILVCLFRMGVNVPLLDSRGSSSSISRSTVGQTFLFFAIIGLLAGVIVGGIGGGHQAVSRNLAHPAGGLHGYGGIIGAMLGMVPGVVWWLLPQKKGDTNPTP